MSEIKKVIRKEFQREVMKADKPVLAVFTGEWSVESKLQMEIIKELADSGKYDYIKFVTIDVDEEAVITARYNIINVPSMIVFNNGTIVNVCHGFTKKSDIEMMIM